MSCVDSAPCRFAVLGSPDCKRVSLLQAALSRQGLPPAVFVSYADVLRDPSCVEKAVPKECFFRIETFGKNFEVERQFLAAGADADDPEVPNAQRIGREEALRLPFEKGRLRYLRQRFLGFRSILGQVRTALRNRPDVRWLNPVEDILVLCDKARCHAHLAVHGLPLPRALPSPASWDHLLHILDSAKRWRVFLKPRHGSSAAGIVALAIRPGGTGQGPRQVGYSTVEIVRENGQVCFYNSRKIRKYTHVEDLAAIVDMLAKEGLHVEEWRPKAALNGCMCDLRVVVIAGQARHRILRLSRSPMTNLHLLNDRACSDLLRERMDETAWTSAMASCEAAARQFPGSLHVGIDLLVLMGFKDHAIAEANAFGDLLPTCLDSGEDTYSAEIKAVLDAPERWKCSN